MRSIKPNSIIFLVLILAACVGASAQTSSGANPTHPPATGNLPLRPGDLPSIRDDKLDPGSAFDEILERKRISLAKEEYHANVDRAREISQVSAEILEAYNKTQQLSSIEIKKLDHLEKLAKKVREQAGGSDTNDDPESMPPDLKSALVKLSKESDELRDKIEKTSYLEVSMAVISRANDVLELIKYLKKIHPASS